MAVRARRPPASTLARVSGDDRRGKGHLDVKSAFPAGTRRDRSPVGFGDCPDYGQAEPVSVVGVDTLAAEVLQRLEEPLDLSGRDDRTGVVH
jgi:hypothetical protein